MYHVRVTTSLLADAATACDGKLYVHGGGWDVLNTANVPFTQAMAIVLMIDLEPSEVAEHKFEISLVDDGGAPLGVGATGRIVPGDQSGLVSEARARLPLAIPFQGVMFSRAGIYRFQISIDEQVIHSVEFAVRIVHQ